MKIHFTSSIWIHLRQQLLFCESDALSDVYFLPYCEINIEMSFIVNDKNKNLHSKEKINPPCSSYLALFLMKSLMNFKRGQFNEEEFNYLNIILHYL